MAKVQFGIAVTDIRGAVGSVVYSKNKAGAYSRERNLTVQPSTPSQIAQQGLLTTISQAWQSLTEDQRFEWNNAVSAWQRTDVFGNVRYPSGFNLYMALNCNLVQVGLTVVSTPPLPSMTPSIFPSNLVMTSLIPSMVFDFTPEPIPMGYVAVLMATTPLSPGTNFLKNQYRQIDLLDVATTSPYNATAAYLLKFTTVPANKRVGIALVLVNTATGQKSPPVSVSCITGA